MTDTAERRLRLRRRARAKARAPVDPEGRMPLLEHLRELRDRVFRSVVALTLTTVVAFLFYEQLFRWLTAPFSVMAAEYNERGGNVTLAFTNVADSFTIGLKIAALAGVFLASPVWLYQLWAFVLPGLHRNERRWGIAFITVSTPLFLAGAYVAYIFLPKGFDLLIGFNPDPQSVDNIIGVDRYLSFLIRMFLVFGFAFVMPVFIVALNLVGVVSARALVRAWRPVTFGAFVFAAVATPSGDPWTMSALAVPMLVLYWVATGVCAVTDRRRRKAGIDGVEYAALDDDVASPLPLASVPLDDATLPERRSAYDDDVT